MPRITRRGKPRTQRFRPWERIPPASIRHSGHAGSWKRALPGTISVSKIPNGAIRSTLVATKPSWHGRLAREGLGGMAHSLAINSEEALYRRGIPGPQVRSSFPTGGTPVPRAAEPYFHALGWARMKDCGEILLVCGAFCAPTALIELSAIILMGKFVPSSL